LSSAPAAPGDRLVLAVDLGTGGPKVGLVSVTGTLVVAEHLPVRTRLLRGGGAVQDATEWWALVCASVRRLLAPGAADPSRVCAVSCTGQWASTVPVGESGEPVGDCVLWLDTRGEPFSRRVVGGPVAGYRPTALARWVRRTGGAPSTSGADPIGHMLYLEHEEPAVARAARWYLEPVDFLTMCFTGVAAASHASMAGAWLTDNRHLDRLQYDPVLVAAAGVPGDKLPPLLPTCSVVGAVTDAVAQDLGIPSGVPVVAGTPDLHSAAAGAGAIRDFETHLTISTTSWISCPVPFKKTDAIRQVASVPGLGSGLLSGRREDARRAGGGYLVANNHETGGRALEWARDALFGGAHDEVDGDASGLPSYDELTGLAARVPAGSGGVLFTPWLAGERSPVDDRRARGGFHNLSLSSTRADMVRAVLEGVAYNSRWLHEAVERFAGRRLDPIRVVGGGAASELWCQIHADVMGRTVERVAEPLHANLRGAALLAGLSLGHIDAAEVRSLVRVAGVHRPELGARAIYEPLYQEFPQLYRTHKPIFARLNG
jgi:xylulokinase